MKSHASVEESGVGDMNGRHQWAKSGIEPSLAELLADPITQALMEADRVRVKDVLAIINRVQRQPCLPRFPHGTISFLAEAHGSPSVDQLSGSDPKKFP
jgi:hypothetical protein